MLRQPRVNSSLIPFMKLREKRILFVLKKKLLISLLK